MPFAIRQCASGFLGPPPTDGLRVSRGRPLSTTVHRPATWRRISADVSGPEGVTLPEETKGAKALAEAVTAILAALTAAAALIVIPGSLAILLRLEDAGLPADLGVVVSLPSELLFAVGFGYVLVPLLVVLGLAIPLTLFSSRPQDRGTTDLWIAQPSGWWDWLRATAVRLLPWSAVGVATAILANSGVSWWWIYLLVGAVVLLLPELVRTVRARRKGQQRKRAEEMRNVHTLDVLLFGLSGALAAGLPFAIDSTPQLRLFAVSYLTVLIWLYLTWRVAREFSGGGFRPVTAVGLFALVGLIYLPWAVDFAVTRGQLPLATVCTSAGGDFDGRLVGETDNRVYIGEPASADDEYDERIASLPAADAVRVFIGGTGGCPSQPSTGGQGSSPGS